MKYLLDRYVLRLTTRACVCGSLNYRMAVVVVVVRMTTRPCLDAAREVRGVRKKRRASAKAAGAVAAPVAEPRPAAAVEETVSAAVVRGLS